MSQNIPEKRSNSFLKSAAEKAFRAALAAADIDPGRNAHHEYGSPTNTVPRIVEAHVTADDGMSELNPGTASEFDPNRNGGMRMR